GDATVFGIAGDAFGVLVGARAGLPDVRHSHRGKAGRALAEVEARRVEPVAQVLGDRHRSGEASGADAPGPGVSALSIDADLVVGVLGRGTQAHVDGRDLVPG